MEIKNRAKLYFFVEKFLFLLKLVFNYFIMILEVISMVNILPADTYTVINKTILTENDRKILTMLYQPIIGSDAINLFFTLWMDLD